MKTPAEKSLLRVAFPSNAAAQQPSQNRATGNATGTQQAPVKPASLLDIARNKLRNKHATSSKNGAQQAHSNHGQTGMATQQAQKAQLETDAYTGDLEAIRQWLTFIGENDPAIINEVLTICRTDADARRYFIGRAGEG